MLVIQKLFLSMHVVGVIGVLDRALDQPFGARVIWNAYYLYYTDF